MTESLVQSLAIAVVATLLSFELIAAAASWLSAGEPVRLQEGQTLWFTRPIAIRGHLRDRRGAIQHLRRQYASLRSIRHAHDIRNAIRRLQRAPSADPIVSCRSCRWSRRRALGHCLDCGRRLVLPAHAATA
jgi:hypothetical protein